MDLSGNKLVIPLFDSELTKKSEYELCKGISIITLSADYESQLRKTPELIARYESSLSYMRIGLAIEPKIIFDSEVPNLYELIEYGCFIAMTIRLVTGVPVDIPYWFDVEDNDIIGCGISLFHTYRTGNRYSYPLDDGKQSSGLDALQLGLSDLSDKFITDKNKNVLIRAIEFSSIGFQTRHIPSRLVNNTIFIESLFCLSNTEISFQIASAVSWYLKFSSGPKERLELFEEIKKLYNYRSKIVHGSDISSHNKNLRKYLLFSEEINTLIVQKILSSKHVNIFSMKENERQKVMKSLLLGIECDLFK